MFFKSCPTRSGIFTHNISPADFCSFLVRKALKLSHKGPIRKLRKGLAKSFMEPRVLTQDRTARKHCAEGGYVLAYAEAIA